MAIATSNSSTWPNYNFTTNPTYTGSFIPSLWSGKLNVKFYATTVFGEIANTSYEGEIKGLGDKITINNIPSITINDYTIGTALTYEIPVPSTVVLTIDKAKYFGVNVSDVLEHQSKPNLMNTFTDDAAMQMKVTIDKNVLDNVFSQADAANKGATAGKISGAFNLGVDNTPITLSSSNTLPLITSLATVLDEQNVPETDRFLVMSPQARQSLMQSDLGKAYLTGDATSMVRNGKIGTIDRFTVYVSNQLPKAALDKDFSGGTQNGAAKRHVMLAGHKTAITFASQITKVENLRNPNDFGELVRGLNVFGYKVIKPESLAFALVA